MVRMAGVELPSDMVTDWRRSFKGRERDSIALERDEIDLTGWTWHMNLIVHISRESTIQT